MSPAIIVFKGGPNNKGGGFGSQLWGLAEKRCRADVEVREVVVCTSKLVAQRRGEPDSLRSQSQKSVWMSCRFFIQSPSPQSSTFMIENWHESEASTIIAPASSAARPQILCVLQHGLEYMLTTDLTSALDPPGSLRYVTVQSMGGCVLEIIRGIPSSEVPSPSRRRSW